MENTSNNSFGGDSGASGNGNNDGFSNNNSGNSFGNLDNISSASNPNPAPQPAPAPKPDPIPTPVPAASSTPLGFTGTSTSAGASNPVIAPVTSTTKTTTPPIWKAPQSTQKVSDILNESDSSASRTMWIIGAVVVILLLLAGGGAYWYANMAPQGTDEGVATSTNGTPTNPDANPSRPGASRPVAPFTAAEQQKVSDHIKRNINALSPVKSSRGFTVTEINFDGPNRGMVEYNDGTYGYVAVFTAYIDASGNVQITSFTILEK